MSQTCSQGYAPSEMEERAERLRFRGLEVVHVCECGMAGTEVLCAPGR
jgi:hypothetical protein